MGRLDGKRILVIGASAGIGRTAGLAIAHAGAQVALAARRADRCGEAAAEVGDRAIALSCDVRDPEACERVVREAVDAFGGLDAFVYSSAVSPLARLAEADSEMWHAIIETNLIGAGLICRAALPHLRESEGRAVFLSSSSVGRPYPALSIYAASKAGLETMVQGWRAENPDVCFSCIIVGPTEATEFATAWDMDLAIEMLPFWAQHGYDAGGISMRLDDMAATIVDVLASPVCLWTVWAQADPANPAPIPPAEVNFGITDLGPAQTPGE